MKKRYLYLDYLKGLMILLMVLFHIKYFTNDYPLLYKAVYTFHMSIFLVISGFLVNIDKSLKEFARSSLRIVVPYIFFELLYIILLTFLGNIMHANNTIENLSYSVIFEKLVVHPIGTYWYLHTLFICMVIYYLVFKLVKIEGISALLMTGVVLYLITFYVGIGWASIVFFLIGVYIARFSGDFINSIPPSLLAVIPLCILFSSSDNYNSGSLAGISISVLMISCLLFIYDHLNSKIKSFLSYVGKNSLAIVVFSPIFTILTKFFIPFFDFDSSKICFALFATVFTVVGCLLSSVICDKLHISKFIFRKEIFYNKYAPI